MTKINVQHIESNIPIPVRRVTTKLPVTLHELKVGQSQTFPIGKRNSVQTMASRIKKLDDKEFTIRKINEEYCRIWRTK